MRTHTNFTNASLVVVLLLGLLVLHACSNCSLAASKFEKTDKQSAPFEPNGLFILATHNGSIKIAGTTSNQCNVVATVHAKAPTEAEAKKLAEKVSIELAPKAGQLTVKVTKPENLHGNRSIDIDFDVTLPTQTTVELTGHNGSIDISNITGEIKATTHNGDADVKGVCGKTDLKTHNGEIEISCAKSGRIDLIAVTHNGNIRLEISSDISAKIDAQTHNGSVNSAIPLTVTETPSRKLQGTIGSGEGKIDLKTHNGSIKINALSQ